VINEVYYDVASDKGSEGTDEWLELYNNSNADIDLNGWRIRDNSTERTINQSIIIPVHGFALISESDSTWIYWDEPAGAIIVELGTEIGNGLGNTNDYLILKDPGENIVDNLGWGTVPSPPPVIVQVSGVAAGHSLERTTDGVDTDVAGDFSDTNPPKPGE
jgi:hypothetical protein